MSWSAMNIESCWYLMLICLMNKSVLFIWLSSTLFIIFILQIQSTSISTAINQLILINFSLILYLINANMVEKKPENLKVISLNKFEWCIELVPLCGYWLSQFLWHLIFADPNNFIFPYGCWNLLSLTMHDSLSEQKRRLMIHLGKLSVPVPYCESICVELVNTLPWCPSFSYRSILCLLQHSSVQLHIGDDVFIKICAVDYFKVLFLSEGCCYWICYFNSISYSLFFWFFFFLVSFLKLAWMISRWTANLYTSFHVKTICNEISMRMRCLWLINERTSVYDFDSFMVEFLPWMVTKSNGNTLKRLPRPPTPPSFFFLLL